MPQEILVSKASESSRAMRTFPSSWWSITELMLVKWLWCGRQNSCSKTFFSRQKSRRWAPGGEWCPVPPEKKERRARKKNGGNGWAGPPTRGSESNPVCLEALAEKGCSGQWTTWTVAVDYWPIKIKVLRLRAMAMCLWVPYLRGSLMGGAGKFIGLKTKLFERIFSQEFRNLKLYF